MQFLSNPKNLSHRISMASPCMQLRLQCRRFLLSKPVASGWFYHTTGSNSSTKVLHASLVVRRTHKTTWTQHQWMQQILSFSGFAVRRLSTDTKGKEGVEELSITDVETYKSPLLPVRDAVPVSHVPLGKYWSGVYHKESHNNSDLNDYL